VRTTALRVAPVLLGVAVFYTYYVRERIRENSVLWFVHLGHQFLTADDSSTVLTPALGWQSPVGYDGQYYYGVAVDPVHAHSYIGGNSGYVYSRILYPVVSRVAAGGSIHAVPYAMLVVNLVAVAVATVAIALWLVQRGLPAWPAALYALFPGLVFAVFRDLTEPLAFALAACAMLAFPRRLPVAAALFALALLTRETVVPFALAAALALVVTDWRGRRAWGSWRRGVLFALAACAPLFVWRLVVTLILHQPTQESGHGASWVIPFHGIASYWPWDRQHRVIVLTIVLPTILLLAGAVVLIRRRRTAAAAGLVIANALVFVVFLPDGVDVDYDAAARAAIGVVLAGIYCLPGWWRPGRRAAVVSAGAFVWSLAWYLVVATWWYGLDGIRLITQ
jgi:hypothetical protein